MKYLVIIPAVTESVTDKCLDLIRPEHYENILIIDNSKDGFAGKYGISFKHFPENIGVARSWNIGVKKVLEDKLDYLIIMSSTVLLKNGLDDLIKTLEDNKYEYGFDTQIGWHLICFSRKTFEMVGLFDENFYPAYYEDSDYIRRMELMGIHCPVKREGRRLAKVQIDATTQGTSLAKNSGIPMNIQACLDYFISKWGDSPRYDSPEARDKLYDHPFNNYKNPIDYFPVYTVEELKKKYSLDILGKI